VSTAAATLNVDGLSVAQIAGAEAIIEAYTAVHLDPAGGIAVALNESDLEPAIVGDQGTSYGLFQLHRGGALPASWTAAQAEDPLQNARYTADQVAKDGGAGLSAGALQILQTTAFERPQNVAGDENPQNLARAETIVKDLSSPAAQITAAGDLAHYSSSSNAGSSVSGAAGAAAGAVGGLVGAGASDVASAVTDTVGKVASAVNWLDPASWVRSITNWIAGKALLALASVGLVALGVWLIAEGAHKAFGTPGVGQMAGVGALAAAA
jgi:hypothetical protein